MVLTVVVPKKIHQRLEREKRLTGLSKSDIVRQLIMNHFEKQKENGMKGAA